MKWQDRRACKHGFNRSILKCKWDQPVTDEASVAVVLIEAYWNVNLKQPHEYYPELFVLIEAYWNVNWNTYDKRVSRTHVLIEAYWNVNEMNVERKAPHAMVLIEAYWNVNMLSQDGKVGLNPVLIEAYWNVNSQKSLNDKKARRCFNRSILKCKYQ